MITSAAVKIFDLKQGKEITIPCHRHCDAFYILKEFGYKKLVDFEEVKQGFLDEHDTFFTRTEAWQHALKCGQLENGSLSVTHELFSEDLW